MKLLRLLLALMLVVALALSAVRGDQANAANVNIKQANIKHEPSYKSYYPYKSFYAEHGKQMNLANADIDQANLDKRSSHSSSFSG